MSQDPDPTIIDLHRYKQAARARAKAAEAQKAKQAQLAKAASSGEGAGGSESFFGSRPKAPLIVAALLVAFFIFYIGPRFL